MRIAITGYSGFVASEIRSNLKMDATEFLKLDRNSSNDKWIEILTSADVIINLAGAPVIQRWSKKNKHSIFKSRVETTKRIVSILNSINDEKKRLFISASAIGIYPDDDNHIYDEDSSFLGHTFLSQVVQSWEQEAKKIRNKNVRLVIPRIGVVLGLNGGLIKQVLPLFKMGVGGQIASGRQALSFIHIEDLVRSIQFFIQNNSTVGCYNLVSPKICSNAEFTRAMGKYLKRPTFFMVPAFALKLKFGQAADIMIKGEKVYPKHLMVDGFKFKYQNIDECIQCLFAK